MTDWLKSLFGNAPDEVKQNYGYSDVAAPPEAAPVVPLGVDPITNSTHMAESLPARAGTGNPDDNYHFSGDADFDQAVDYANGPQAPVEMPGAGGGQSSETKNLINQLLMTKSRPIPLPPKESKNDNVPMTIEAGQGTGENSGEALREAQQSANMVRLINNLGAAGSTYVSGAAGFGAKADTSAFDKMNAQADNIVKDQQARGEQEKKDPNSPVSKAYKKYLKDKFKVDVKGDISADQLEKLYPMIQRSYENEELRKSREDQNRLTIEGMNQRSAESSEMRRLMLAQQLANQEKTRSDKKEAKDDINERFGRSEVFKYQKDAEEGTKKMRDAVAESDKFKDMSELALTNPQAANQLGITLAKSLGETGALSAADVTRYIGRKDLAGKVAMTAKELESGTISEENRQYLGETLNILQKASKDRIKNTYLRQSERYAQNIGTDLDTAIGKVVPRSDAQAYGLTVEAPKGKVKVTSPDGKAGFIPEARLKEYLANGYTKAK